jgi:acetolactate synthase-1/2/3 large subunit
MSLTKLSDFVARYLWQQGIGHVFVVSGGASIHLMHSLDEHSDIEVVCPHHEQGGAMAADAYARTTGGLGCAIGTSGPGATNMITGIASAWFDSVPTLFITGQVTTFRMKGDLGVRQMGFQETDIIPMVEPITKHAYQIRDPLEIKYRLDEAVKIAKTGRPGPVVIDIPDDIQRSFIDEADLIRPAAPHQEDSQVETATDTEAFEVPPDTIENVLALMARAERPVIVFGWGVRLADAANLARQISRQTAFPILTSWAAKDIIPSNDPNLVGTFGTHGTRTGNFAVQNCDLVVSIGARLSTRETGSPLDTWARGAKIVVVDIDETELGKFGRFNKPIDIPVRADAGAFLRALSGALDDSPGLPDITAWRHRLADWSRRYPPGPGFEGMPDAVEPYAFFEGLSERLPEDAHLFIDTGCSIAWMMQAYKVRADQRLLHDFNLTAMGWALPAAMGGSLALRGAPTICISGDGSLMMNLQELATIERHQVPVRIIVVNNNGYSMVQQTQEQWFGGRHVGTSEAGGLGFPDFVQLANAFRIPAYRVSTRDEIEDVLPSALATDGPVLIDLHFPSESRVRPQAKFGYPIEDSEPLLPREEFLANMLVAPLPKSLEQLD